MKSPNPTLKVLHVAETAKGGVGSYIDDVASLQIARHGDAAVRVVLPDAHAAQLQRVPAASQRRFQAAGGRLLNTLRMLRLALAQVREWQPDVVHLHSTFAGFALRPLLAWRFMSQCGSATLLNPLGGRTTYVVGLGALLSRSGFAGLLKAPRGMAGSAGLGAPSRPRIVYCAHGWAFDREGHAPANRVFEGIERLWSRWCDVVVCVSAYELAAGARIGIARHRLALVNNGIRDVETVADVDSARAAWPPGVRRVLFVGRLDRQKGVDILFDAMRRLDGRAFALIVGASVVADDGPAALPPNVRIVGWLRRDEIAAYYAAADVVLISSRWEAFSLVAVEAMRAGRAVVASAVGGLRDVVADGVTGLLVAPESAAALAAAVEGLSDEELLAMGQAGRARYERCFRIERVADELDALYRSNTPARRDTPAPFSAVPSPDP